MFCYRGRCRLWVYCEVQSEWTRSRRCRRCKCCCFWFQFCHLLCKICTDSIWVLYQTDVGLVRNIETLLNMASKTCTDQCLLQLLRALLQAYQECVLPWWCCNPHAEAIHSKAECHTSHLLLMNLCSSHHLLYAPGFDSGATCPPSLLLPWRRWFSA